MFDVTGDVSLPAGMTLSMLFAPDENVIMDLITCSGTLDGSGTTWNTAEEIVLAVSTSADMGYSSTVELDNGNLLTVYYMHEKPKEGACLMGTLWRPAQR